MKIVSRVSTVDVSKCVGCKTCEAHCPTGAIKVRCGAEDAKFVAPCQNACPAGVDVQGYVALAAAGRYEEAYRLIRRDNPFPSVCGRICTHPCQDSCNRGNFDSSVAIRDIKRFVADWAFDNKSVKNEMVWPKNGKKVGIIGAGPSGLTCAYYLALSGCEVNVYDSAAVAGGVLAFGIPEYRLPKDIIAREVKVIEDAGVKIHLSCEISTGDRFDELRKENDAVYIATGTQFSRKAGIPGEDMDGVMHGLDFLKNVNLGSSPDFHGKKVVVIGGGNTAMDASRTAIRLGAESVTVIYRRREVDMPADVREVMEAKEEGVRFEVLAAPEEFAGAGKLEKVVCARMEIGEKDAKGRRTTHKANEALYEIAADVAIVAVSQYSDFPFISKDEVEMSEWGKLSTDENMMTSIPGVFAGGDVMRGSATAIRAIADGKIVARSICSYLGLKSGINQGADVDRPDKDAVEWNAGSNRPMPNLINIERIKSNAEVAIGISEEQLKYEAARCNHCNGKASVDSTRCIDCQMCWEMCPHGAITMAPLEQDKYLKAPPIKPEQYDQLFDICHKAKLMPMDFCCVCTFTLADEIVSCILNGAHTVEDICVMCGIRGGCSMYCTTKILRLLTAAGYPQTSREDGGWYDVEIGLTTLTDDQIAGCDPVFNLKHEQSAAWSEELFQKNVEMYKMLHAPKEEDKK